jgi:hypothetical protein
MKRNERNEIARLLGARFQATTAAHDFSDAAFIQQ